MGSFQLDGKNGLRNADIIIPAINNKINQPAIRERGDFFCDFFWGGKFSGDFFTKNALFNICFLSSGVASLDDAAVKAAFKNRFKPGIQNGRPIACWVSYTVDFDINDWSA